MKIYCNNVYPHTIEDMVSNTTDFGSIDINDRYEDVIESQKVMIESVVDGETVLTQDVDEEGNLLFQDVIVGQKEKNGVVEFEIPSDHCICNTGIKNIIRVRTYFEHENGSVEFSYKVSPDEIQNVKICDKHREILLKIELESARKSVVLRDISMYGMIYAGQGVNIHE